MHQSIDKNLEKNIRLKALGLTILINGALFLLLFYVKFWSDDPKMEVAAGGFEINYGDSNVGSGTIEEEVFTEEIPPQPPQPVDESALISSKQKSPVKLAEKKEVLIADKKEVIKTKDLPKEPNSPEPIINKNALFKSRPKKSGGSNGDDIGKLGDKGQKNGDLNNNGLYAGPKGKNGGSGGGEGGGDGLAVNLSGWKIAGSPQVNDQSAETGTIRFSIKINETGNIISLQTIESTVSVALTQKYKQAVSRLKFVPSSSGVRPSIASGTISFNIRAN